MKVLHIITGLSTGGTERALFNRLAGGLSDTVENVVISLKDKGTYGERIENLGVAVYTLGIRHGVPGLGAFSQLIKLVKAENPDIVEGWMYHGNLAAFMSAVFVRIDARLIFNIRQSLYDLSAEKFLTRQVIRLNKLFSSRADLILYVSRLSKVQHENYGFSGRAVKVLPNGFNLQLFRPDPNDARKLRASLGIPASACVVGHVARYHPVKDHESFLLAAIRVAKSCDSAFFVLAGTGVDKKNKRLTSLVPDGITDRFYFLGERNDVNRLMRIMDVFCQSSYSEAFPNVLGEAMASGVPCVATDVGDSAFIVGDTGGLVPPRDIAALEAELTNVISMQHERRHSMGLCARDRVMNEFSIDSLVEKMVFLYEELCKGRKGEEEAKAQTKQSVSGSGIVSPKK